MSEPTTVEVRSVESRTPDLHSARLFNSGPFRFGFITTLGVLLALVLGLAVGSLSYALSLIFLALFLSLGLYPLVLRLQRLTGSRGRAVLIVMVGFLIIVTIVLLLLIPVIVDQAAQLIAFAPEAVTTITSQDWFRDLNVTMGGELLPYVRGLEASLADPSLWVAVSGGALRVGANVVNGTFGVVFVVALTLYFVASLEIMKSTLYSLVPASRRDGFAEIAEEISQSVGKYLDGMFVLALINASFSFLLLTILGVPYAGVIAAIALPITFIPLVGSVLSTTLMVVVSLFSSPTTALIVLIVMLVYMQIEAYALTPRIVGKAIQIPGALVLIGAMVGATLLGLLGALVACPISASILLIIKKVIVPAQNAR
jgi:predicted PurR-regulated permease PerM